MGIIFDVNSMPAGLQSTSLDPQNNPTNKVLLRSITEKRKKDSEMVTYFSVVTQVGKRQNLKPAQSVFQDTLSIPIPKNAVHRHALAMHFVCSHTYPHSSSMLNFEQCLIFLYSPELVFSIVFTNSSVFSSTEVTNNTFLSSCHSLQCSSRAHHLYNHIASYIVTIFLVGFFLFGEIVNSFSVKLSVNQSTDNH